MEYRCTGEGSPSSNQATIRRIPLQSLDQIIRRFITQIHTQHLLFLKRSPRVAFRHFAQAFVAALFRKDGAEFGGGALNQAGAVGAADGRCFGHQVEVDEFQR